MIVRSVIFLLFFILPATFNVTAQTGILTLNFLNTANGKPLVLADSSYNNAFNEKYQVTKLRYYISHITVPGSRSLEEDPYHLVNARNEENSFSVHVPAGIYNKLEFLLGVDSAVNFSGAQSGDLDPMNDMFWTWNSGYVVFKLEGNSRASTADLNRIEHHIGGYKGEQNVSTTITLDLPEPLHISAGKNTRVDVEMNLDRYWKSASETKISDAAVCMTTGSLARRLALNFPEMFSVKHVVLLP